MGRHTVQQDTWTDTLFSRTHGQTHCSAGHVYRHTVHNHIRHCLHTNGCGSTYPLGTNIKSPGEHTHSRGCSSGGASATVSAWSSSQHPSAASVVKPPWASGSTPGGSVPGGYL
jgi:hypothetical protein